MVQRRGRSRVRSNNVDNQRKRSSSRSSRSGRDVSRGRSRSRARSPGPRASSGSRTRAVTPQRAASRSRLGGRTFEGAPSDRSLALRGGHEPRSSRINAVHSQVRSRVGALPSGVDGVVWNPRRGFAHKTHSTSVEIKAKLESKFDSVFISEATEHRDKRPHRTAYSVRFDREFAPIQTWGYIRLKLKHATFTAADPWTDSDQDLVYDIRNLVSDVVINIPREDAIKTFTDWNANGISLHYKYQIKGRDRDVTDNSSVLKMHFSLVYTYDA